MSGLLFACLVFSAAPVPDTTISLEHGDRVVAQNFSGRISVEVWGRPELLVRSDDDDDGDVDVRRAGSRVVLEPRGRGRHRYENLTLQVPSWVSLSIEGNTVDVSARGLAGALDVRTMRGDVRIEGTSGDLGLYSAQGEVSVRDARGKISARSEGDDVLLQNVRGEVTAGSGSGDVRLVDVDASNVHAETLDGEVDFSGPLHAGGRYVFSVHDGDVVLTLPQETGAHVSVSTFDGEFTSEFPVTVNGLHGAGKFQFTLGSGGADLEIEVFDGEIRLSRRR